MERLFSYTESYYSSASHKGTGGKLKDLDWVWNLNLTLLSIPVVCIPGSLGFVIRLGLKRIKSAQG